MEASFPESYNYPSTAANNDEREQGEEDKEALAVLARTGFICVYVNM